MPKRWLSIRKLNPAHNESESQSTARQHEFDFAFAEQPPGAQSSSPRVGPRLVQIRPGTAGGITGKRKPAVELPLVRPRTSENHKPWPLPNINAVAKSDDTWIGLALGSPSHPPTEFGALHGEDIPTEQNSFARRYQEARDMAGQMQSKRWRKFGTLFKSRSTVRRDDIPAGPTIGLPMGLVVLDKEPTEDTEEQTSRPDQPARSTRERMPLPPRKDSMPILTNASLPIRNFQEDSVSTPSTINATDASSSVTASPRRPLPLKLELAIPRNLEDAKRSSSLLARRSRTFEGLKSFDTSSRDSDDISRPSSDFITTLMPPRRLTTPTMTRSPVASKYSLFPTTSPAPVKFVGRVPSSERDTLSTGQLKRSATSPARVSPMQDRFSIVPTPEPLHPRKTELNELLYHSPEDNTASTDRSAPWSSSHSFQSSVSSATTVDEIFFDIKSFRDSKGVEDGQFVMTRPESSQIELARTRSKRAPPASRLRQMEASRADEGSDQGTPTMPEPSTGSSSAPSNWTGKHTSVSTAYFDEAIAAVERLTMPTSNLPSIEKMPAIPTVTIAHHDDKPPQLNLKLQAPKPSDLHLRLNSKTREEVSRLIPSPVVEVREDDSPRPGASTKPAPTLQSIEATKAAKVISPRMAAMHNFERPIADSPTIPQGPPSPKRTQKPSSPLADTPPPVPKKDAKFIPMSKYAPKGTATAIEQRAGVVPTRPVRSNTDDTSQRSSPARASKERSATLPSSLQPQPQSSPPKSSLRGLEKVVPARPNPVGLHPTGTAEVAVARTISLSRKQSARVHVAGPKLAARRAEGQLPTLPKRQPSATHNRNVSTVSQKSTKSTKSLLGHRHKRTTSSAKSASRASKEFASKTKVTKTPTDGKSGSFGKFMWSKESEKQMIKEARKWEILEKKSYSPIVVQAERGHRPGLSVGLVVEST